VSVFDNEETIKVLSASCLLELQEYRIIDTNNKIKIKSNFRYELIGLFLLAWSSHAGEFLPCVLKEPYPVIISGQALKVSLYMALFVHHKYKKHIPEERSLWSYKSRFTA
jgi:hypothetical protein